MNSFVLSSRIQYHPNFTSLLSPQAKTIYNHIRRTGSITQRQALMDYSVQSLTKRISELNEKGIAIDREFRYHPITGQRYAVYSFACRSWANADA